MPKYTMSDGRAFTDYQPNCSLVKSLQEKYSSKNSTEFRYTLQKNGEELIKQFSKTQCKTCPVCGDK